MRLPPLQRLEDALRAKEEAQRLVAVLEERMRAEAAKGADMERRPSIGLFCPFLTYLPLEEVGLRSKLGFE